MLARPLALFVAVALAATLLVAGRLGAREVPEPAATPSPFQNVEVLTGVRTKTEMRELMKRQAAALGVKCVHCHVPGRFHLDDKPEKVKAREMLRMVAEINARWFAEAETPAVTCWTCHRGATEPEHDLPPGALAPAGFEALDE